MVPEPNRTRVLIKQERRKQKEYFERNRLKSKMKLLGVLSPAKNSTASLDLLNLYMVNQISCKKKTPETVKKPFHVNMNSNIKMLPKKRELELPMSPHCTPSKLCLDDVENNIHYQKLGNKEELGQVQLSQVKNSYSMFEPQFSKIEKCNFTPPSFSAELSSHRHIPKQNLIPRIASSPQSLVYEKKQDGQLNNVDGSNSLVSKINESQDELSSSYKPAQFGTLFERLNSLENGNFLSKRSAIIMSEDFGNMNKRRQSDFIIEKQSIQQIWGENGKEVSSFLENVNEPTHRLLSENCDSFVPQNMINLLDLDQQRVKKTFDKCGYDSLGDICLVTSSDENHSIDGNRSIFTAPESTFSSSTLNKTSYPEKHQPNRNYQEKHNNNEINDFATCFEDCYLISSEKKGKLNNVYQEKTPQKNIQEYPVNSMGSVPLQELYSKQSWDLRLGEIVMEEGRTCSLKGRPTSTKKICLDSSQSSQSASYSPRPTDSCLSSSSEMPSEDEDQMLQQIEDSNKICVKTTETTNDFHLERMSKVSGDRSGKDNAKIHKQTENFYPFSVKNNTDQSPQLQCNSAHVLQNKINDNCILPVVRCDAGVQTEREPAMEEKFDAAVQCNIISLCTCRSDVSPLCHIEIQ
ncbi:regulator of DNA class I crossover intermediates 1 isoform X2 [Marmota flaviventris]|uniref:regulator of DNA class I crossover intermediates 1 isoform X2 n=1 Tax=Marmota flaviventris TaxID=93162 RepID=UPI003A8A7801